MSDKEPNTNNDETDGFCHTGSSAETPDEQTPLQQDQGAQNSQEIKNNASVNSQTIAQEINNFYNNIDSQANTNAVEDPTIPLPPKPSELHHFNGIDHVTQNVENFIKERILVCSCHDYDLRNSAAYSLVESSQLASFERRLLTFEGRNQNRDDISLDFITQAKIGQGSTVVIVTTVTSRVFLDSLFSNALFTTGVKNALLEKDILLLCLVEKNLLQESLSKRAEQFKFCHWDIPFLRHTLSRHFSGEELTELESKIIELRELGLWGDPDSDLDFYRHISGYLREDTQLFGENVRKWHLESKSTNRIELLKNIKAIQPDQVFKFDDKISRAVLYIAVFFSELTRQQFNNLVEVLLSGLHHQSTEIEAVEVTDTGEKRTVRTIEQRTLIDIWQEQPDLILASCHLLLIDLDNRTVIDFSAPYLRKELAAYLKKHYPNFLHQQFEKLHHSGVLFQQQTPERVVQRITNLSVAVALSDQETYGSDWLLNIAQSIGRTMPVDIPGGEHSELNRFLAYLASSVADSIRHLFYGRLAGLIREMLDHPVLENTVRTFFERMMSTSQHNAALTMILEISKRLKDAPQFENFYWVWMKRILDQGDKETKQRAYKVLQNDAMRSRERIYQYIQKVKLWLPDNEVNVTKYSPSNAYALRFLLDYCIRSTKMYPLKSQGQWPSAYPLFMKLEDNDSSFQIIEQLVRWLCHSGLDVVSSDMFGHAERTDVLLNYVLADLVEQWFLILFGTKLELDGVANTIAEKIIFYIVLNKNKAEQKMLLGFWRDKRGLYLKTMGKMRISERIQKQRLARQRKNIINIEQYFKQSQKAAMADAKGV